MEAAYTPAQPKGTARSPDSERRCLVTGEVWPKTDLIRFVVGPDDVVVPDLAQNLPGRGLWIVPDRAAIATAITKKLYARAAKGPAKAEPDLIDQVIRLLHKRCLDFLGLARRSGVSVLGQPQVEAAIRSHTLKLLLIASDASDKGVQEIMQMRVLDGLPILRSFKRDELGAALGYEQIVYAGLKSHALTTKLHAELGRLDKLTRTHHVTE